MSPLGGRQSDLWTQVAYYASLGFILPAAVVIGCGMGWMLDHWLHTSPVLSIVFAMLGAAGGLIEILQMMKRAEERASGKSSNARPGPK
jgi:F0F1-type ATP synthase assembly protein I